MHIKSIRNGTIAPVKDIRQERVELSTLRKNLLQKISGMKNCVTEINKSITAYKKNIAYNQSLLKSLQSVSAKHGENATVRLKDDHFKYGQASNFFKNIFHGSRYQTEREAAVKKINAEGSTVSTGKVIKTLQTKIDSALSKVKELKTEGDGYDTKIDNFERKKYDIEKKIDRLAKIKTDVKEADKKTMRLEKIFQWYIKLTRDAKRSTLRHVISLATLPQRAKLAEIKSLKNTAGFMVVRFLTMVIRNLNQLLRQIVAI